KIRAAAASADTEEDLRIASERALAFIEREAGIKLEGRHEYHVASGRVDSFYQRVIIEYKNPKSPADRLSAKKDAPGCEKVISQIKRRFHDLRAELRQPLNNLLGVGLDGNYFIFVRFYEDEWHISDPVEVDRYSAGKFLWALFNLGQKGRPFRPEYLAGDFGCDSPVASYGIKTLYETICSTGNPKAQTFFNQWKILFGEVCGYDVHNPSGKIKNIGDLYGISGKLNPAELLFALHTYYALFMKLLASEVVAFFHKLPTPRQKIEQVGTSNRLKKEMEDLEAGSIFRHLNITNFLEGDLFAWYPSVWSEPIENLVRKMVAKLGEYNPGTLSEEPEVTRDLLKKLYQNLLPKSVRHDLGEYYTPDWLAEHVLNELEYTGDPDKRLLDPACGSGTFLVMAISRIRRWYHEHREECRFNEGDLCRRILSNIIGFDLNPLAVMAARTNYLIAIHDLISHVDTVEIPVYLCDSIMTPSEYGEKQDRMVLQDKVGLQDMVDFEKPMKLKTSAQKTPFYIPREVTANREVLGKYTGLLDELTRKDSGYSVDDFIQRCVDEAIPIDNEHEHRRLFNEIRELDKANKNRIWARIIKNYFAPLFIDKVDYVAGNPPWVNWENLPPDYRQSTAHLWQKYDLFRHKGYKAKLGGGKDDISILMTYVAHDCYLSFGGRLGFVITQTVFKTKGGGEGFRTFKYQIGRKTVYVSPVSVHDFSDIQPFEGAANRTAVVILDKSTKPFSYPVPYIIWKKTKKGKINPDCSLDEVISHTKKKKVAAIPVDESQPTSPWLTAPEHVLSGIKKVIGKSDYTAHAGCCTWLNGVYWIRILKKLPDGNLLIENLHDVGKIKVERVQASIEPDLVYPLLRGRDVKRWRAEPSAYVILANKTDKLAGIPESIMKKKYPKTYAYLKQFEQSLRQRSGYRKYFKTTDPFYSMYDVGPYTLAMYKVVWPWISIGITASVVSTLEKKSICPEHNTSFVDCDSLNSSYFLCALLNSTISDFSIRSFCSGGGGGIASPLVLKNICIPKFDIKNKLHLKIAKLSKKAHKAAKDEDEEAVSALEVEIDKAAAKLWGITNSELRTIQSELE
ncbi:MAG: N-6 DNA methylase, partial [bacterium]